MSVSLDLFKYLTNPGKIHNFPCAGFVITHVPGAMFCERWGTKLVLVACLFGASTLTLFTSMIVSLGGAYALMAIRFVIGLLLGCIWSAVNMTLAAWVPKNERSAKMSLAFCGLAVSVGKNVLIRLLKI